MSHITDVSSIEISPLWYISTSVWVLHTPNAGPNGHFLIFCAKKLKSTTLVPKKVTNLWQNSAKKGFLKFAPKHWSRVLFPPPQKKNSFSLIFVGYIQNNTKNAENAENDYFDQCLGCTAPKRWLKYKTPLYFNRHSNLKYPVFSIGKEGVFLCQIFNNYNNKLIGHRWSLQGLDILCSNQFISNLWRRRSHISWGKKGKKLLRPNTSLFSP